MTAYDLCSISSSLHVCTALIAYCNPCAALLVVLVPLCSGGMYRGCVDHTGRMLTAVFPEEDCPQGRGGGSLDEFQGTFEGAPGAAGSG